MGKEYEEQGCCIFCGQIYQLTYERDIEPHTLNKIDGYNSLDDEYNHIATMHCSCNDARHYQHIYNSRLRARENIDKLFTEDTCAAQKELLKEIADFIAGSKVKRCSMVLGDNIKASLSMTTKGSIKVKRTVVNEAELES